MHNTSSTLPKWLNNILENLTLGNNQHIRKSKINQFDNSKWNSLGEKEKKWYPSEQEAQQFIRKGFEKSQKI